MIGYDVFWRGVCVCDEYGGEGRYHYGMAWCGESDKAEGGMVRLYTKLHAD